MMSKGLIVAAIAAMLVANAPTSAVAGNPYPVNIRVSAHKAIELDPDWLFEADPCFSTVGDLSEVFNAEGHALAAGIDEDGNFIPPMHVHETVEESILFEPADPSLPTYTGHSTVHTSNYEDSPNAGFTNTVTLKGSDGSHLTFHQTVHLLAKSTGITFVVDNVTVHC